MKDNSPEMVPKDQKSILFLGTQMEVAGAQNVLLSQARWFYDGGYKVTVAFFYDKQGLAALWRKEYPFQIVNLNAWDKKSHWISNIPLLVRGLIRLKILLFQGSFDVIETFTHDSNLLGIPLAWLARIPIRIATHHGQIQDRPLIFSKLHGVMVNLGIASRLVVVSSRVKNLALKIERVNPDRIELIYNGISLPDNHQDLSLRAYIRKEFNVREDAPLIITVGRLTIQKGHTYLLDAIPKVLEENPEVIFIFAGEGAEHEFLKKKANNLGIEKSILFTGIRTDIPNLLITADLFVLPSISEGLPLALLEAMSMGLPVIATNVVSIDDVIEKQTSGIIVPSKDPPAIAEAINKLLGDKPGMEEMGRKGKEHIAAHFSLDQMCSKYEELFCSIK